MAGSTSAPHGEPASSGRRAAVLSAAALFNPACGGRPRALPIDQLHDLRGCAETRAPALLVLLPGAHMTPAELQDEGFVAAPHQRGLAVDVVAAHTHLGLVQDGSVLKRLRDEVVAPALGQGYRQVWLAGISLGGFVAMAYAMRHPGEIAGLVALAPYLGRRPLVQALAASGAETWRRTARPRDGDDLEHELWMWLSAPLATAPPLYLGFGSEDRFAQAHRLLAGLLPPERVRNVPGGHDWAPWRRLWADWLDRRLLPGSCTG